MIDFECKLNEYTLMEMFQPREQIVKKKKKRWKRVQAEKRR